MCGIAGWIDWMDDLTRQGQMLERMADTLSHRGPDEQGQWLTPHAALAHRRLIVIDPEGGGQPMVYREGERTYALTYNGELYNFREVRSELESRGHSFRTRSDTEVLLHAYVEWGEACVHHFNGIFAFGLWDSHKQQLLLARDHLGVKPLFYAQRGSAILFGSELKALLAHPAIRAEVNGEGLAEVLTFVRTPGSGIYRDVHELRPGHLAICREQGMRISRYWSLRSAPHTDDLETTSQTIRALLADTVRRQLIADVAVVTLNSGGLDSSGLTDLAAAEFARAGKGLRSYSLDFVGSAQHFHATPLHPSLDAPWAEKVAAYAGTQHQTITVDTPALVENLLVPLEANDFPAEGEVNASLYLLFQVIKQEGATVVLSGEGADEVFGGYPWFHSEAALAAPSIPWLPAVLGPAESALSWVAPDILERVRPFEYLDQRYRQTIAEVPRLEGEDALAARRRELLYLDLTHLLPFLLDRKDRVSMATGLEVRVPYCDHRLVEYVWNIPFAEKTVGKIEKGILRKAMTGALPEDVRMRRKSAYPSVQNPEYVQATREWTQRILNDASAPVQPFLDRRVVSALVENTNSRPGGTFVSMFECIIQLDSWMREYQVTLAL